MTSEQIKLVNDLQAKIDKLSEIVKVCNTRDEKYDGITGSTYSNYISLQIFPKGDLELPLYLSRERNNILLNQIVETMEAELQLLTIERDSYILSKPV